jgi:hypothetical protein
MTTFQRLEYIYHRKFTCFNKVSRTPMNSRQRAPRLVTSERPTGITHWVCPIRTPCRFAKTRALLMSTTGKSLSSKKIAWSTESQCIDG